MPRSLDTRLYRVEGRRTAGAAEQRSVAIRNRHIWRAEVAMGAVIRDALARAGVDAAQAVRLCLADEAAAALAALPDTPELQRADNNNPMAAEAEDCAHRDAFESKMRELVRRFVGAPPPDFANASFAELFAWALAQTPGK
jgi:hypothetical protein